MARHFLISSLSSTFIDDGEDDVFHVLFAADGKVQHGIEGRQAEFAPCQFQIPFFVRRIHADGDGIEDAAAKVLRRRPAVVQIGQAVGVEPRLDRRVLFFHVRE